MKRVLIVEDEAKLARLITRVLWEEGYAAEAVCDGRSGFTRASAETFDLVILDWMLPDRSGIQIVRGLRAAEIGVPVLMLTARSQVEDRVDGLDAGADDYLPKPFAFAELLARVRALTRRPHKDVSEPVVRVGDLTLDPMRRVVLRDDERIDLTAKEFALLSTLLQHPGQVFTRSVLLDIVWGGSRDTYTNVVELAYRRRPPPCTERAKQEGGNRDHARHHAREFRQGSHPARDPDPTDRPERGARARLRLLG